MTQLNSTVIMKTDLSGFTRRVTALSEAELGGLLAAHKLLIQESVERHGGGIGEAFLAFVNAKGSSSRRAYDAHTGRKIGKTERRDGLDFSVAFADDINAGLQLNGGLDEQQLEEWAEELPSVTLDELNGDLKNARAASDAAAPRPSEHPAAS